MNETDGYAGSVSEGTRETIELRVTADLAQLPIIRSLAANIAIREDYDLDTIADLKLAVDEACATVIPRAQSASNLLCRFSIGPTSFYCTVIVEADDDNLPSTESFGWQVLTTLTDSVTTWVDRGSDGQNPHRLHIELCKRKPVVTG